MLVQDYKHENKKKQQSHFTNEFVILLRMPSPLELEIKICRSIWVHLQVFSKQNHSHEVLMENAKLQRNSSKTWAEDIA